MQDAPPPRRPEGGVCQEVAETGERGKAVGPSLPRVTPLDGSHVRQDRQLFLRQHILQWDGRPRTTPGQWICIRGYCGAGRLVWAAGAVDQIGVVFVSMLVPRYGWVQPVGSWRGDVHERDDLPVPVFPQPGDDCINDLFHVVRICGVWDLPFLLNPQHSHACLAGSNGVGPPAGASREDHAVPGEGAAGGLGPFGAEAGAAPKALWGDGDGANGPEQSPGVGAVQGRILLHVDQDPQGLHQVRDTLQHRLGDRAFKQQQADTGRASRLAHQAGGTGAEVLRVGLQQSLGTVEDERLRGVNVADHV
mmetsp:Transcript_122810/g.212998  ORF Transcript_122810/g.212998 Transcript_122810/m.212998 type:complete len:306 (-) Transcript_122810:269-1186(-)